MFDIQDESQLLELPSMGRGRPSAAMLAERARLQKVIEANRKRLAAQSESTSDQDMLDEWLELHGGNLKFLGTSQRGAMNNLIQEARVRIGNAEMDKQAMGG